MARTKTINGLSEKEHERIQSLFANHHLSERQSISWHMSSTYRAWQWKGAKAIVRDDCHDSTYAYSVTWTPGTLVIAGDLGEFTVTHYNAMRTIKATIEWLDGIHFHYLMGKSDAKEQYDQDETLEAIIRMANEEAIDSMRAVRDNRRERRRARAEAEVELEGALDQWEADACREAHPEECGSSGATDSLGPKPRLEDFFDAEDCMKLEVTERPFDSYLPHPGTIKKSLGRKHDVPDGWELWYRIWDKVNWSSDPNDIFSAAERRFLKDELRGYLEDQHSAVDLCSDLQLDDFYGVYEYPFQCHVWHAAIQAWVKAVRPLYCAETAKGRVA